MDKSLASELNCLNLVRIIAAVQVMFGHLVEHMELPINDTVFRSIFFLRGVPIFFAISGFLIWFSIGRSKSYKQYLEKRFWRIYPELWVAVIIELIILVVLYRGWNLKSLALFAFGQSTLFQFWTPDSLRGYGVGVPNGALWTISVMIQFYVVVWFFYKIMDNRKLRTWVIGFGAVFGISFWLDYFVHEVTKREIVGKLYDQTIIKYFWIFYIGMFIAEFKKVFLPMLQRCWYICLIIAAIFFVTEFDLYTGYYLGWSSFLVIGLIGFAYRFPQFRFSTDISYGLFLYHMTVINIFANFEWTGNWFYVIPIVIVSLGGAYISTVTIGRMSLLRKRKMEVH
ncbi:MAG: acyltransferase [Lachnospiraceae bacterium]|nr:acyltransferase [uncultured Acetatifactor sp.]MCI8287953.1 acyltransferase [Lachnospiraceae bacterium]